MGAVTGKGLSDLIREEFGLRITFFLMLGLLLTNLGNVVAEFAGIAGSMALFGIPIWVSVPACAALVWVMVVKGSYKSVEKVFFVASFIYISYIVAGVLAHPDWKAAGLATVVPPNLHLFRSSSYLYMVVGVIGTTIAPWMQFYLHASVVEKGITEKEYFASRLDVIVGCIFAVVVAAFIVVACAATLFLHGQHDLKDGAQAAQSLRPLAGRFAYILFAVGLFNASLFAASILPISTAYAVCEGLGVESGLDKKFDEAPFFYWLYTGLIVAGAGVILWPNLPLVKITILSQVVNGAVLPFVLVAMLLLINKRELMGRYVNRRFFNLVAWLTAIVLIVLTVMMLFGGSAT
jgi:Mn2+/Fe2+ NRAMP family transporter